MKAEEIIQEISELDSLFGMCAKKIQGNSDFEIQFIEECFDQIKRKPIEMELYFGSEFVLKIEGFCKQGESKISLKL